MSLSQIKTLIIGVLRGWFSNKKTLDKFSESSDGKLLYDGKEIQNTGSNEGTGSNGSSNPNEFLKITFLTHAQISDTSKYISQEINDNLFLYDYLILFLFCILYRILDR